MKEKILDILRQQNKALTVYEINDELKLDGSNKLRELLDVLTELENDTIIYKSNKDKYLLFENSHLKKGRIQINKKGFGFLLQDGDDIYIDASNLNDALDGDFVVVELISKKSQSKQEGRVLKIVKREFQNLIGEIFTNRDKIFVKLDNKNLKIDVEIEKNKTLGAVDGHKVVIKLLDKVGKSKYKAEVLNILGHKDDPGVDILSIINKYNIKDTFDEVVIEEIKEINKEVLESEIVGRRDLRNVEIFTIDGADTKDIDDAISIKKLDNGNYLLGVHIADVSYYVKEGTELDNEAMYRGTSVYLVDRVIPMLPHELSNGICSLNPDVDRLAISCEMEIDNKGNVVTYDIFESVIKSKIKMTYKNVNYILEDGLIPGEYEPYVKSLYLMKELADILRKNKEERGYIEFGSNEAKIIVDENCHPIDIKLRYRGIGENLIEDFMIIANETVATHIYNMELPFIYRIHEYPKEEKINNFISFVSHLGYSLKGKKGNFHPKDIQNIIKQLEDKKEYPVLSNLLLRSMQKAIYSKDNNGHYGLASSCYTHFTSPIRRYPDTTVHRLLRTYLFDKNISKSTINHWDEKLVAIAEIASEKEIASIECEREVTDMKMAEYMEDHIGEVFEGIISSVLNFGMFVELPNLIEGLVHINNMKDDYYIYSEETLSLTGERTGKHYKLGDTVTVKVTAASKEAKTIDFMIYQEKKEIVG